jgi:hypothetical protein
VGPQTEKVSLSMSVGASMVFLTSGWAMLEKVLGDVALWCWPYLVSKPSHTGIDVDGLANPLHYPTACSRQSRGQGFLSDAI